MEFLQQLLAGNAASSPLRHCTFHLSFLMAFQWQWRLNMLQKAFWDKMVITYVQTLKCRSFFRDRNTWNSQTRKGCVWNEESAKLCVPSVHLTKSRIVCKTVERSYVEMDANRFYYTLWHRTLSSEDKNMVTIHHWVPHQVQGQTVSQLKRSLCQILTRTCISK